MKNIFVTNGTSSKNKISAGLSQALCVFVIILALLSNAADTASALTQNKLAELKWQLDKTISGVEFFYAISSCGGQDVVFLKMKNNNNYSVEISWKEVFQTQLAKEKEAFTGGKKIVLPPGELLESDCTHPANPSLLTRSSQVDPTYVVTISKFNYKDILVNKMN